MRRSFLEQTHFRSKLLNTDTLTPSQSLAKLLTFAPQEEKIMNKDEHTPQEEEALNDAQQHQEGAENETEDTAAENTVAEEEDPIRALEKELADWKDKYTRLYAEFDNFRKRNAKERLDLMKSAGKDIIQDMLPLIDDFERAEKANADSNDIKAVKEGYGLIQAKLLRTLEAKGLKPMDSMGKSFDVEYHEAITNIPAPSKKQVGKVVDVVEKGYFLNDNILRYAKVVVGQ
jgi:molecular chaperone GrpE